MAFSGSNGASLWRIPARASVFELKCPEVDVDFDGINDCFASGRFGTLIAFNPRTGLLFVYYYCSQDNTQCFVDLKYAGTSRAVYV